MSSMQTYTANTRTAIGSRNAAKLRKSGFVPVTVSRPGKDSTLLQVDEKSASHLAAHVVHLCKVEVAGKPFTALRGEIVKDVLTDKVSHIDLIEVDEKSSINVDVVVNAETRNCPGIKAGGILEQRARKITVRCKANAIPDSLSVDLSKLELQESMPVSAVPLPAGVTLVTPGKQLLLSIVIPRGLKSATDEAAKTATADGAAAATPAAGDAKAAAAKGAPAADAKAAAPAAKK
jgi:large subunit ribosomal protein L25